MNSKLPKVTKLKNGECYVTIYRNEKRVRVYSGEKFGISISPNSLPKNKRYKAAKELALRLSNQDDIEIKSQVSDMDYFKEALADKLNSNLSEKYKQTLSDVNFYVEGCVDQFDEYVQVWRGETTLTKEVYPENRLIDNFLEIIEDHDPTHEFSEKPFPWFNEWCIGMWIHSDVDVNNYEDLIFFYPWDINDFKKSLDKENSFKK